MNPRPTRTAYILRVQRQGRRLQLELVDLRSGERHPVNSLRDLWRLLQGTPEGLR